MNFDHFLAKLTKWFTNIPVFTILFIALTAYIAYKVSGPIIEWLTRVLAPKLKNQTRVQKLERQKRLKTLSDLFTVIIRVMIMVTAVYSILIRIGINLTPLLAGSAVVAATIGFGAQNIVKDCLAGFFIILENQYRVGDYVSISGVGIDANDSEGTITAVSLRKTTLRDRAGNVHFIPNGNIYDVTTRTMDYSQFRYTFAVSSDTDVDAVVAIVNNVGQELAKDPKWEKEIVDAPHYAEFGKIGKAGMNVTTSGTTLPGKQWKVSAEFKKRLIVELQKSDIEVADVEQ